MQKQEEKNLLSSVNLLIWYLYKYGVVFLITTMII